MLTLEDCIQNSNTHKKEKNKRKEQPESNPESSF